MNTFILLARPWWVNLLILVPLAAYFIFKNSLRLNRRQLIAAGIFGIAFGFVEASVVVYLRAATGLLTALPNIYQPAAVLTSLTRTLFVVEFFREAATLIMLAAVAVLAAEQWQERLAMFLWQFAFWDIVYYLGLWLIVRWPNSLTSPDVLFLIPVPWIAQVWFPLLISGLTILVVALNA